MAAGGAAHYTPNYTRLAPPSDWHLVWEEEIPGDLFAGLEPEVRGTLSSEPYSYPGFGPWPGPNQLEVYRVERVELFEYSPNLNLDVGELTRFAGEEFPLAFVVGEIPDQLRNYLTFCWAGNLEEVQNLQEQVRDRDGELAVYPWGRKTQFLSERPHLRGLEEYTQHASSTEYILAVWLLQSRDLNAFREEYRLIQLLFPLVKFHVREYIRLELIEKNLPTIFHWKLLCPAFEELGHKEQTLVIFQALFRLFLNDGYETSEIIRLAFGFFHHRRHLNFFAGIREEGHEGPVLAPVSSFIRRDPGAEEAFHRAHSYIGPIPSSARYRFAPGARLEEPFWSIANRDSTPFFGEAEEEENSATGLTFQAVPLLGLHPDWIGREGHLSVLRRYIYAPTAWIEEARRVSELVQKEREEAAQARVRANQQGRN